VSDPLAGIVRRNFFVFMALLVAAIVAFGFGHTINAKLIHPPFPRPPILYVHVTLFTSWVLLFITQTTLVHAGNVGWHRRVGAFGIALGCAIPIVGTLTAITMTRLNIAHGSTDGAQFLVLDIYYMIAFAVVFGLAAMWRTKPEFHRRLMLIATCLLTVAAFARFPGLPVGVWDVCVDALILLGVARDWIVAKRVHLVYRYALPLLVLGQVFANYTYFNASPWWLAIAHRLLQ
jgi:hypothetical protein